MLEIVDELWAHTGDDPASGRGTEGVGLVDVSNSLGKHPATVEAALDDLEARGLVTPSDRGIEITDRGARLLESGPEAVDLTPQQDADTDSDSDGDGGSLIGKVTGLFS